MSKQIPSFTDEQIAKAKEVNPPQFIADG